MSKPKISVYFFTNGQPFKPPHKVVIARQKLEENQVIERIHRLHYYNGYVVYTLFGQPLRSIQEVHDDSAFVAVPRDQCFQAGPYVKIFRQYIDEKLPISDGKKSDKKKKPITKPLGTSYGCKSPVPRLAKEVRFCPGCRHVAVDMRCQDFGTTTTRGKQDTCVCRNIDPHGECVPLPIRPKHKIRRKKHGRSWSSCFRKREEKKEPIIRMRKRDIEQMEQARAKKMRKPKARQRKGCCGGPTTKEEQYKKERDKLIKQRKKRLENEEKRKLKEQKAAQNRIRSRRRRQQCMARCCPCCVKKPEPIWRQPAPHSCVEHLKKARDQAIRRRTALGIPEQSSWESINFPPRFKKKICSTQTTKEDLKEARKAAGSGWNCFGGKKKKAEPEEDLCCK
ncbi:uncharacterized protein LOC128739713 [Sabethes cyaneus]|uniref:uncharacterized protein LOC128739713 n=1 Tax=Sabethes cyaneus TaxID=53552 RepID=UPI00237ED35F|nr:uncharacterized protein LOC128739713 [Sabethes cyaneus]